MDVVKLLTTRLAHQQKEVDEANKKLGEPGYPKAYRDRMVANCKQTKRMLTYYQSKK